MTDRARTRRSVSLAAGAVAEHQLARTRTAGQRLQFEGSWAVGEPRPWGLYELSDSSPQ